MRLLTTAACATAFLALAGAADARTRGVPPVTPAGKPVDCVSLRDIRETRVRDDRTIDFYMHGRRVYRNVLPQRCPQLGFEERFAYKTSQSELCSVDIITVLTGPGLTPGASCGLGQFQPVTGAPR
jgi:hypothetical protein